MPTTTALLTNTETTYNHTENQVNSNYIPENVCMHLTTEEHNYAKTSKCLLDSCVVVDTTEHNYINNIQSLNEITTPDDYASTVTILQKSLEKVISTNNDTKIKEMIFLLEGNTGYSDLLLDILNSFIIQNNNKALIFLFLNYGIYTTKILNYLLQNQLNSELNTLLIQKLIDAGAKLTIEDIELLIQNNDSNLNNQQLKILSDFNLLSHILDEAIDQDKLGLIECIYDEYGFFTPKSINYLLENLFINAFNITSFNKLIADGAIIEMSTLKKLVASEDINKINNILTLLTNHKAYEKTLTSILYNAINMDKIAIVQLINTQYQFLTKPHLNYFLLKSLKNITDITTINQSIALGATITHPHIYKFLNNYSPQVTDEHFLDFYIQLERIDFSEKTKNIIKSFWQHKLQTTMKIIVSGNTLDIIKSLYFEHGFITQLSFDYILAYETNSEVRFSAEILFEQKYKYKSRLEDISSNL
jgi:hypothetical protein